VDGQTDIAKLRRSFLIFFSRMGRKTVEDEVIVAYIKLPRHSHITA
jgi:hypothetical protein